MISEPKLSTVPSISFAPKMQAGKLKLCATDEGVLEGEQWCKKCIWGNLLPQWKYAFGSVDKISSGVFVNLWTERIDHLANRFSVAGDLASLSSPSESRAHQVTVGRIKLRTLAHARQLRVPLAHDTLRRSE
jgi:hypothetical protein